MTKTDTIPSSAKGFRLIGKLYRWMGWFGILVTAGITLYGFIAEWNRMASYTGSYYSEPVQRFFTPFLLAIAIMACGLTICAVSFLVSAVIETALISRRTTAHAPICCAALCVSKAMYSNH